MYLVDCPRVIGIVLVGGGPEKSCGTRILGLAKIDAVSARALPTTLSDITWSDITWALEAFAPIIMSAQIMSDQIVSAHNYVH